MQFDLYYHCHYNQYTPTASDIERDSISIMKRILISKATASLSPCSETSLKYPSRKQKHNIQAVKWTDCSFQDMTFSSLLCPFPPGLRNNLRNQPHHAVKAQFCYCLTPPAKCLFSCKMMVFSYFCRNWSSAPENVHLSNNRKLL